MTHNQRTTMTMPTVGEEVTDVVVSRWLVAVGDHVRAGSALLEVSTDKVDTEIPAPYDGTLVEILVAENDGCTVGAPLAVIDPADPSARAGTGAPAEKTAPAAPPHPADRGDQTAADVPAAAPGASTWQQLPRIRQIIARRMLESLRTTAQLTSFIEVDLTAISVLRRATKEQFHRDHGVKLSYLPFVARATIDALCEHPVLSATVNDECTDIAYHDRVHLGIAVDSPKGLLVPVIHDAESTTIAELATRIHTLAEQVRNATIVADQLAGATFTITNTGSRGVLFDTPILNPPQPAILGTGAVVDRLVPLPHQESFDIGVRSIMYLALTYDHRVIDGADAARFLTSLKARLESGYSAEQVLADR